MNSNKFEQQILQAVLEIAQERITDTPHQFPPDFEARLVKKEGVSEQTIKAAATESVPLYKAGLSKHIRKPKHDIKTTKFLVWGGLAASILIAVTVTTLLRPEQIETEQSTLIPIEAIDSENAVSIVTTEPAVTLNPEMTSEAHQPAEQTTMALTAAKQVSGTTAVVNAQTMTVTGAENITKSEKANVAVPQDSTESAHIDTEPAPKKNEAREILGDINRDGQIDLKDATLVMKEYTAVQIGKHPLGTVLDDEQRSLAMVADRSIVKGDAEYAKDHVVLEDVFIILAYYGYYEIGRHENKDNLDAAEFGKQYPEEWHSVVDNWSDKDEMKAEIPAEMQKALDTFWEKSNQRMAEDSTLKLRSDCVSDWVFLDDTEHLRILKADTQIPYFTVWAELSKSWKSWGSYNAALAIYMVSDVLYPQGEAIREDFADRMQDQLTLASDAVSALGEKITAEDVAGLQETYGYMIAPALQDIGKLDLLQIDPDSPCQDAEKLAEFARYFA